MKTLVLSMISIAATVAAMTACTSESDPVDEVVNPKDAKVEIKMSTGVGEITTKATATTAFSNTPITILRQDIDNTNGETNWSSDFISKDYSLTGANITLDKDQKYFNNDGSKKSMFIGYSNTANATSNNDGTVSYTITGNEDLLCTQELNVGTKTQQELTPKLNFKHMLSQVEIKVIGTEKANELFGTINSISLVMPTSIKVTLKTAVATATNSETNDITIFTNSSNKKISELSAISEALGSIFVLPGYGKTDTNLTIKLATTVNAENKELTVTINNIATTVDASEKNGLLAGYKHVITLTFNDNITISSEIDTVTDGGNGSGEIEG